MKYLAIIGLATLFAALGYMLSRSDKTASYGEEWLGVGAQGGCAVDLYQEER